LQRNIKRFKLRNVKEPHFLTCKSIPKDIKEAILLKHTKSHAYIPPPQLLTFNHLKNSEDKTKPFLLRMKVFEASKNLEYALCDYGYRRPVSTKLEEYLTLLINHKDETLPKDLLKLYHGYFVWAMLDPMDFEVEHLRKSNLLINSMIEQLALAKKSNASESAKLLQHKLELNSAGDSDFRNQGITNNYRKNATIYENKYPKAQKEPNVFNLNNNNSGNVETAAASKPCTSNEAMSTQYSKTTSKSSHKTPHKNIFRKHSNSSSLKTEEDQDKEQLIMDTSFDSIDTHKKRSHSKSTSLKKVEVSDLDDTTNHDQTLKWSLANKKTLSESEKIPLVSSVLGKKSHHQKKKSNISEKIILDPLKQKNRTSTMHSDDLTKMNSASENEGFNLTSESHM
jgi:hypothetical protein